MIEVIGDFLTARGVHQGTAGLLARGSLTVLAFVLSIVANFIAKHFILKGLGTLRSETIYDACPIPYLNARRSGALLRAVLRRHLPPLSAGKLWSDGPGCLAGVADCTPQRGWWRYGVCGLTSFMLVIFIYWTAIFSQLPEQKLPVTVGQPFIPIVLTDHQGSPFDSTSLVGNTAALYLFYRGNW